MKNPYYYLGANPTVDLVIYNPLLEKFLLILRSDTAAACPNMWALPGGFIDTLAKRGEIWKEGLETPEQAALRETKEEASLHLPPETQILPIGIYEGNMRDPRDNEQSWSKSHAFFYHIPESLYLAQKDNIRGMDDAKDCMWMTLAEIQSLDLAFDHKKIIMDGIALYLSPSSQKKIKP